MAKVVETPIQKRCSDVDIFQHVNNVAQQMYFDLGKTEYFREVLSDDMLNGELRVVAVSTATSYMGQIRMFDDIFVRTTCEKVGNKSLTLVQQIVCGDELKSESRSVMVGFDFGQQISISLPQEWIDKMLG